MRRVKEKILLVFIFVFLENVCSEPITLGNVDCAPYVDYVASDPGLYRFWPMYVEIHRCQGKHFSPNPKNMKCMPTKTGIEKLKYRVTSYQTGNPIDLTIDNHTACSQQCVVSQANCTPYEHFKAGECGCTCNITKASEGQALCKPPFSWQQNGCNCVCPKPADTNCGEKRQFNTDLCQCTCSARVYNRCARKKRVVDERTCLCVEPTVVIAKARSDCEGGVNGAMLAVVIIVEAVMIVFCYYFFYVYCYKYNYLGRKNKQHVSSGFYHNGDIPTDRAAVSNGNYHLQYDDSSERDKMVDKEWIRNEEEEGKRPRHYGMSDKEVIALEEDNASGDYLSYYSDEEKSRFAPKSNGGGDYFYNDIMEVDGPPSSLDNHNLNLPPEYSDAVSDLSETEGSVTQV